MKQGEENFITEFELKVMRKFSCKKRRAKIVIHFFESWFCAQNNLTDDQETPEPF